MSLGLSELAISDHRILKIGQVGMGPYQRETARTGTFVQMVYILLSFKLSAAVN